MMMMMMRMLLVQLQEQCQACANIEESFCSPPSALHLTQSLPFVCSPAPGTRLAVMATLGARPAIVFSFCL